MRTSGDRDGDTLQACVTDLLLIPLSTRQLCASCRHSGRLGACLDIGIDVKARRAHACIASSAAIGLGMPIIELAADEAESLRPSRQITSAHSRNHKSGPRP